MKCFEGFLKGPMVIQNPILYSLFLGFSKQTSPKKFNDDDFPVMLLGELLRGTTCFLEDDLASSHDANTSSLSPKWIRTPYVMQV